MNRPNEPKSAFIDYLEGLVRRQDRGALAALRRGLGKAPGTAMEMHRYVVPYLHQDRTREDDIYYLVAGLFAYWHQGDTAVAAQPPADLGASLARLVALNPDTGASLELRFTALLKSHRDDLPVHLRHAAGLLKSKGVPIHWRQLIRDLRSWDNKDSRVQRTWARSFWGTQPPTEPISPPIQPTA